MSPEEIRLQAEKRLSVPISDGRLEVVVTYRRHEDYEQYESHIAALEAEVKQLKRDIITWTHTGNQYLAALDEIRELKKLLKSFGIST